MGYGLTKEDVQRLAFSIVQKIQCKHPFKDGKAGRGWFDGFKSRHPQLTFRTPQSLSYSRAVAANEYVLADFFSKLGAIYGRLNLITKPMQVFNVDETGINIVHKPGKVLAELGQHHVYSIASAEKGKTHTVVSCVSATGQVLPPMIVYPRKQRVPDHLKCGCVPNTLFANSENGWINSELYLEWFKFFLSNIPLTRPIIIQDGHTSHISIPLIELAQKNDVHMLCLPSHTTHILQPLDVGVFKSFKSNFSKACHKFLVGRPGQVITTAAIASLVHDAWYNSFTPLNILSGFKKCGIHPLNPGEVSDRQLAPSKAVTYSSQPECLPKPKASTVSETSEVHKSAPTKSLHGSTSTQCSSNGSHKLFTLEQHKLFQRRFEDGYDLKDTEYTTWLKIYHPEIGSPHTSSSELSKSENSSSIDAVKELLILPKPNSNSQQKRQGRNALNSKSVCITDPEILEELKAKEAEKADVAEQKRMRMNERAKKKEQKEREKEQKQKEKEQKQKEKEQKQKEKEQKQKEKEQKQREKEQKQREKEQKQREKERVRREKVTTKVATDQTQEMNLNPSGDEQDNAQCPLCGLLYVRR